LKVNFLNFTDPKDHKHFLLTGGEFILKQDAVKSILNNLKNHGFNEKVSISQDELDRLQEIVSRNIGGSLFQENLILHIKHTSGKFPEKIKSLLEDNNIFQSPNIALIVESSIEKTPASGPWIKNFDAHGLIINCSKLKIMEEKIWLKRQLSFLPKDLLPIFGGSIFQNNEANLLGQKNEVALLKLLFLSQDGSIEANTDHIIFGSGISAFELEDLLINRNFKKALMTINFMREHDRQNSAPIIWIIAKVINSCLESLKASNKKSALMNSGVWSSKINLYLNLIKQAKVKEFLGLNEEILKIDLINKGLMKADTWEQIERVILRLKDATALQN
jgi:DNA polymerase III delta subunit